MLQVLCHNKKELKQLVVVMRELASYPNIYNLLFKSCRVAPYCLRKTRKSTVDPPMINLHYYVGISPNLSSIL